MNDFPPTPGEYSMFSNINNVNIWGSTITMINNVTTLSDRGTSREYMPSKPTIFHGREELVGEISMRLCDDTTSRRVRILGPGGMGKTSVALAVVESPAVRSKYGSRCYWVPCINAPSSSDLLQVLHIQLGCARTTDILSGILAKLNEVAEPTLLLLDNFETAWFPSRGKTKPVDDILFWLNECNHVAILLTMRLLGKTNDPCDRIDWHTTHLQPVSNEASRLIFHAMYPDSKEDPDVDALSTALGHMPYAVVLMAKSGQTCGTTALELLKQWNRAGTHMLSHSGTLEEDMNHSISLSVDHLFVQKNRDALLLLQTLALLPSGTPTDHLHRWAPNINSLASAIQSLSNAALLLQSKEHPKTLSILPVVQSFLHTHRMIPEEVFQVVLKGCYRFILDHISQSEDNPRNARFLMTTEDSNIHSILLNSKAIEHISISPHLHFKYIYCFVFASRYQLNPDTLKHVLGLAEELDANVAAQAKFALAIFHARKSECDIAEEYFSESYGAFLADPDSRQDALECGLLLAQCRLHLKKPIIEFLESLQVTFDDDFQKGRIKKVLGACLRDQRQFSEALKTLQDAKDLFIRSDHLEEVAEVLCDMSTVYFFSSQFEESLSFNLKAREAAKSSGIPFFKAAFIDFQYGLQLTFLQRDTEALSIFQKCLPIFESVGELPSVVGCFKQMGSIYSRQGNHHDASVAFESAIARCIELGDTHEIMELKRLRTS